MDRTYRVMFIDDEEAARKLKMINDTLHIYDEDGIEMIYKFENYEIFK